MDNVCLKEEQKKYVRYFRSAKHHIYGLFERGNLVKLKSREKGGHSPVLIVRAIMALDEKQVEAVLTERNGHSTIDFKSAGLIC